MAVEGETRVIGPWEKIKNSFGGMIIGLFLLPGAFVVVYVASKREQASEVMKDAVPAAQAAQAGKKAVFATGTLDSDPIGDPQFVKPGRYLSLRRTAEMYAWEQKKETKKEKDGNTTKETDVYDCKMVWTSSPDANVGSKKGCEGKSNPSPSYAGASFAPSRVSITASGATYTLNVGAIDAVGLPSVKISKSDLTTDLTESGSYFYPQASCSSSAKIGCERISFSGTRYDEGKTYTAVGRLEGTQFEEYSTGATGLMAGHWLKLGPGSFKDTMGAVSSADSKWTMGWYIASVVCFWLGLVLLTGPILQLIEFIPIIGGFGEGLIKFVFLIFSAVVMGLAFLIIEYFWFILVAIIALAAFLIFKKKKTAAA